MTAHDPDRDAAAYVTGTMAPEERDRFEAHLLTCETCWREVRLDREGRALAESARETAPAALRESVRAVVVAAASQPTGSAFAQRDRRGLLRGLAAVAAVFALVVAGTLARTAVQASVIDAAMVAYEQAQVEAHHEALPAPDLQPLGVAPIGATHMQLGDMNVEAFAYRSVGGSRLTLFMADESFPIPPGATIATEGWHLSHGDMRLMTGDGSKPFLAITSDPQLLTSLQQGLDSGSIQLA